MIYRVVLDDTTDIHTSNIDCMLLNPSIELEMNSAGSFKFTLPPTHPNWDDIRVLKSTIDVYENDELIFTGRVANIEKNWNNERVVTCEGALAYFNDSIHRQMKWETPLPIASEDPEVHNFLKDILDNHNVFEGSENLNRHIYVGHIYIDTELVTREVDYDTTLDILTRMCIDTNGGYFQIRKDPEDGKLYLDWLKDFTDESSQPASFGLNLLDFNTSLNAEDICTGVLARGATVNDQVVTLTGVELVDETTYPDMSVTHYTTHDQDILWHRDGVETFGQVVQVHDFSDAQTAWKDQGGQVVANSLFEVAKKWLEEKNTKVETIEVEVAELAWLGEGYPQFKLGQIVQIFDEAHMAGESETTRKLPMYKISCDLTSGSKKVTLGTPPKKELTQISASNSDSSTLSSTSSSGSSGGGSGSGEECKVHDVKVDGTSVVSNKVANISLTGKADVSTVNALATTVAGKADTSTVNALATAVAGKQDQIEFNTAEAATDILTRLKANNKVYNLGGGTEVVANPSETATDDLETIKIGNTVYDIPSGMVMMSDYYSEDEQVVGRWTDGKPIYQKTYLLGSGVYITNSGISISSYLDNLSTYDQIIDAVGYGKNNNDARVDSLYLNTSGMVYCAEGMTTNRITVKYTKTTDIPGTGPTKGNLIYLPTLYSEEEREVGVWTDGKPIYQKTFIFTVPNISGGYDFSASTPNLDDIVETYYSISDIGERRYVPWYNNATVEFDEMTDSKVSFYFQSNYYAGRTLIFTAKYTKTTDQPGSGTWTPEGQLAHHYSTSEKIVGTWIDGSTVYERTWDFSSNPIQLRYDSWVDSTIPSSDGIANIIDCKCLNPNYLTIPGVEAAVGAGYHPVGLDYCCNTTARAVGYLTLRYTKSS